MAGIFQFLFNQRPQVDTQNTGRDVYMRPFGVGTVSVQGLGGTNNFRSLSPVNPETFNTPYVTPASVTGKGSPNSINLNPNLEPLVDQNKTVTFIVPQF